MKTVLVTGGTGFLGSNLALALLKEGTSVRILRRASSDLRAIGNAPVEHCVGDILDPPSLRRALHGCDTVFHTAALISYWRKERERMMEVNVTGTRNVVEASLEMGVTRFIHTSSVAAIGLRDDGKPADEETTFRWDPRTPGYRIAKHLAEQEVLKGVKQGLPAVIVNPSIIIGPRDLYVRGGQLIRDIARKRIFYATGGGMNVVDVDDVVRGHVEAARRGRIGERYILGGENLSTGEVFSITAEVVGGIKPLFTLPAGAVQLLGSLFESIANIVGVRPWITRELVATVGRNLWYSSTKAERDLGYTVTPLRVAVEKTYRWYREHGFL
jgi:dihydroflavonol-4-reductase